MLSIDHTARIAFQVIIQDDSGGLILSAVFLSNLFSMIAQATGFIQDTAQAIDFTAKVLSICIISLAWGIGVI